MRAVNLGWEGKRQGIMRVCEDVYDRGRANQRSYAGCKRCWGLCVMVWWLFVGGRRSRDMEGGAAAKERIRQRRPRDGKERLQAEM